MSEETEIPISNSERNSEETQNGEEEGGWKWPFMSLNSW